MECFAIIKDYFLLGKHSLAQYKLLKNSLPGIIEISTIKCCSFYNKGNRFDYTTLQIIIKMAVHFTNTKIKQFDSGP